MTTDTLVESTLEDGVLTIVMNTPERLNAMSWGLLEGLESAFGHFDDAAVRVVVIAGNGRAFCAGADMRELAVDDDEVAQAYVSRITRVIGMVRDCPKPVIAAVQGWAVGGGAELALEADLLVLADDAVFRQPDVSIGSTPATAYRLVQLVGVALAARVVLAGEDLDAATAHQHGLVSALHPADALRDEAARLGRRLAAWSPQSLSYAKQALRLPFTTDGSTDLRVNLAAELACYHSPAQRDAVADFLDR